MRHIRRVAIVMTCLCAMAALQPGAAFAQRQRSLPAPSSARPHRPVTRSAVVFVGGYFYDPFFGPYPWWVRHAYPYA